MVLILVGLRYKLNGDHTSVEVFAKMIATMNPVAVTRFFVVTYRSTFEHLLATGSMNKGLLGPITTYFGIVERNGQGILHLHFLVYFCDAFHIIQ